MSDQFVQQADPEAVFTALADETRLKILQALWELDTQSATFSELRDAVGMRDSGQFNYHLDELVGRFVSKTDGEYALTQAGKHVNGAIASGIYTGQETIKPIELESDCRACGGDQTLHYEDEVARVECGSCPVGWSVPVPPAVLAGYDRTEIPQVVSRYFQTRFRGIVNGFCAYCDGQIGAAVGPISAMDIGPESTEDSSEDGDGQPTDLPVVQFDCQRCGSTAGLGLDHALLLSHTDVAQFYHEHGIDVRESLIWDSELDLAELQIEHQDPIKAHVAYRKGGDELTLTVDETFTVINNQCGKIPKGENQ